MPATTTLRWWEMARRTPTFLRFVVGSDADHHRRLTGIITEVRSLRDDGWLSTEECDRLEDTYDWFNAHLPCPPFTTRGWPCDVVCWFKSDARASIARMWDLAALLREHDVPLRMLTSANPGKVVYEDDHQVVVVEWNRL